MALRCRIDNPKRRAAEGHHGASYETDGALYGVASALNERSCTAYAFTPCPTRETQAFIPNRGFTSSVNQRILITC